jgi:hypothetical protein
MRSDIQTLDGTTTSEPAKLTRITVDLAPELYSRLINLTASAGQPTKAATVRTSLQLLEFMIKRWKAGDTFFAKSKDGEVREISFFGH